MKQVRTSLTGRQAARSPEGFGDQGVGEGPGSFGQGGGRGTAGGESPDHRGAKESRRSGSRSDRRSSPARGRSASAPETFTRGRVAAPGMVARRQAKARAAMPAGRRGKPEEDRSLAETLFSPLETAKDALLGMVPQPVQQAAKALGTAARMANPAALGKTMFSEFIEPGLEQDLAGVAALRSEAGLMATADEVADVRSRAAEHDVTAELSGMVETAPSEAQTARDMLDRAEAVAARDAADRAAFGPDTPDEPEKRPPPEADPAADPAASEKPGGVEFSPMTTPTEAPNAPPPGPDWLAELKRANDAAEQTLRNRRARRPRMPAFV